MFIEGEHKKELPKAVTFLNNFLRVKDQTLGNLIRHR